jgi:DNA-binding XRE family transcriptional regulator
MRANPPLTQMEVSYKIGVSRQTAADWEKGGVQPSGNNLLKLAGLMSMKPEQLRQSWAKWYSSRNKVEV